MPSRTSVRRGATINYSDDLHVKDEANEEDEVVDTKSRSSRGVSRTTKQAKRVAEADEDDDVDMHDVDPDDDFMVPDDDEGIVENKQATKPATSNVKKRKSHELDEEEDEEELDSKPEKKKKAAPKKAASTKKAKKEDVQDSAAMQAIYDSIPTVRAPSPPPATEDDEDSKKKKFDFRAGHANTGAPPAAGSKDMPIGAENCLAGISFVFTGLLQSLGREEGKALVKRYGGKVMAAPSKKTDWVVLGSDAGPKKLGVIHDLGLRTIDEDGLFELIRRLPANGGDSKAAAKFEEQAAKEMEKVRAAVAQVDKKEKEAVGAAGASVGVHTTKVADPNTQLWTVKHAPTAMNQICGNKGQVEKLQRWLKAFPKNQRTKFKMAGSDGSGVYRAVLIHGPPGIGKTTAAHLVARLEGYDVVESNASDTRSKKLVEVGLKGVLSTTSLLGYFAGDGKEVDPNKKKLVLIMDEVDGMSAGDRGGVGALAAVCKKSQIPMILICNDRRLPKMKPFDGCTYDLPFRRPTVDQIRTRIMTINYRENMKMPPNVIDALIEGSHADIRQVVNMVSTAKLDLQVEEQNLDYDRGKQMSKAWEKHVVLRPWDIVSKILGGGMFAASSKSTLNDKAELYFNDHEFSPLMLQENYLGTNPIIGNNYHGREKDFKNLELVEQAANSISEGDLVDRMIHGTQQQWSLMPVHAIFSFVRPASFVAGSLAGHQTRFTQWLGKNSAQGKAIRQVKEIQGHMRLRSSADRNEIRQQYLPALWAQLVKKLEVEGKDSVPIIINLMDSYFLTRDDWDAIYELGVGPMDAEKVKIETQSKATFTRLYDWNRTESYHPLLIQAQIQPTKPSAAVHQSE